MTVAIPERTAPEYATAYVAVPDLRVEEPAGPKWPVSALWVVPAVALSLIASACCGAMVEHDRQVPASVSCVEQVGAVRSDGFTEGASC